MLRRIFGSEKAPHEGVSASRSSYAGLGTMQTTTTSTKAEDNKSPGNLILSHSLPDLAITTATTDDNAERMQGQPIQAIRINWPKDSHESANESMCSDPVVDQFQSKPVNMYRSAENLLGVEGSQVPRARRVFSLKKPKHEQSEDFFKNNQSSSSNSTSLLSVDFHVNDILKSEEELNAEQKYRRAPKEKAATLGQHRSFMDLLHADYGSSPKKSKDSLNTKSSKRSSSKYRKRALTLTGTEFLKPSEVSKSPMSEADGVQSEHDALRAILSRQMPEWRSSSVKATSMDKHSEVITPSKRDLSVRKGRTPIIHIPISKLSDHLVLALDGLEEDNEVQVVRVDASTLPFKPEELVTGFEDTLHINKASISLDCIAVLLPSSRHSSHNLANLLPQLAGAVKKVCIAKGSVALSRVHGTWSYSRFLFLTSEHLLIMKQKTMTTFKLKKRVAVSDLWLAPNLGNSDEMSSGSLPLSFIIGWPLATNYLFLFTKAEQKMMWMTLLERQISMERQNDLQNEVVIKITTQDTDCTMTKSLVVNPEETVFQVVQRCSKELHLVDSDPKHFELCLKSRESIIPLIGHETPFYIQLRNLRVQDHHDNAPSQDHAAMAFEHFVLRPKKLSQRNGIRRRTRRLTLVGLFGKKSASPQPDVLQSMPQPKLFGRNLSEVCLDGLLPKPILNMLQCLYVHGPTTPGIFRKSGNHRDLLELKARLDAGEECNIEGLSIHVAASALKNWLRSLPDCLLTSRLYKQWIEVVCISDSEKKSDSMKRLVLQLPSLNILLLRYLICVLHRVGSHAQCNHMTSGNLAICLGPTILWPTGSADLTSEYVAADLVTRVTHLLIDDAKQILGDDSLELFKGSVQEVPVDTELNFESEDSMGSHEVLNAKGDHENNASLESLDNFSFDDGLDTHSYSAVQSQMSIDSGLAVSNPRLNDEPGPDLPTIVIQVPSDQPDQPRYAKRQPGTKKKAHTKSELSDISEAFPIQDAEERPNSKMAGASNVRQRVSRFQASKVHTDDSLSCGETFESSDDEFMQTSISSSENFVEVSSSFGDANSLNDGTSREFEDHFESDDNRGNNGPMVSEVTKRALPAPVNAEQQMSVWSLKKVDASVADSQKEADRLALALDQKIQPDPIGSGNEWYFMMGPEKDMQLHSGILKVKQKSNIETLNKTNVAENVQVMQDKVSPKQYKPSSNSLRCGRSAEKQEHIKQPVKQISLDDAMVHNSFTDNSGEAKPTHAVKAQPVKVTLNNSDTSPLCLRLTGIEVLESQSRQKIHSSQDLRVESSVSSHNINSESSYRRPVRNRSVPRRLTDVAVNTSDSFFQSSRGVQTEPLDDQNIPRPVDKFRYTSLNLSGDQVNEPKRRIECNGNKNQEEKNRPVYGTGRRFKSDLGLSSRRSWREDYADNYSDDALKAFSTAIQGSQTERHATRGRNYALGQSVHPEEQVRSLSEESDHCIGHRQVRKTSVHDIRSAREPNDYFDQLPAQNNAPVSIEQRIRDRRTVTVVTIGDTVNRSRICDNKQVHQPAAAYIPEREFPISRTRNQHIINRDNRGSKTIVSDGDPLKSNVVEIHSNKFNQNSSGRNARDFAYGSSRMHPTYATNASSTKLELQSSSDTLNNSAASRHSSAQVQSQIPSHGMDDHGHKTDSQNRETSRNFDSASYQFRTPQQGNKFPKSFSVNRTPVNGEIAQRGSLKARGEGRRDTSQNIDAALHVPLRVTENSQKDVMMHDDSQRRVNAKGLRGTTKPVVASHEFDIGKMVESTRDNSRIHTTTPVNVDDSTITWSVNELRKRFDTALPNSRFTQQNSSVKKQ